MTTQQGRTPPPQYNPQSNRIAPLLGIIAAGLGAATIYAAIETLMSLVPGLSFASASFLIRLAADAPPYPDLGLPPGPAQALEARLAPAWLATYLVTGAGRLADAAEIDAEASPALAPGATGPALMAARKAEERYFSLHLAAEERRLRAAAGQDMAALLNADRTETAGLLGWRAVLDDRTTPECGWAHGRNFKADAMPSIGWPGAVHMRCRCSAGPAVPGAPLIPSA